MNKQTFQIPDGCKAVIMEQVGNQIITTFEPVFKRGDVLITEMGTICIFKDVFDDGKVESFAGMNADERLFKDNKPPMFAGWLRNYRHATPEEAQRLWDALAKEGKRWNPETMEVEPIKKERWRAEEGNSYYCLNSILFVTNPDHLYEFDDIRYSIGNYFQTEEQAQRAADLLQKSLAEFWEEELI